jgi:hypothetical protein
MSEEEEKKPRDTESEVWNAISAFERILEVMPDDRTSLDTLVHAYTQLGDYTRARDYLMRLAKVVADERDGEVAGSLIEQLRSFADTDPAIRELINRLEKLASESLPPVTGDKKPVAPSVSATDLFHRKINITDELSFAWDLLQAGELTQEQYAEVVQDLTDISSNKADKGAVSMIHVIETRGFGNMDRIMAFASRKGDTPIILLSNFDINDEATSLLPIDYMNRQGVLPFDLIGPDALVVVQNPYDRELRKHIEQVIGRHCHFFLSPPSEFTTAIARITKKAADAAKAAATAKAAPPK